MARAVKTNGKLEELDDDILLRFLELDFDDPEIKELCEKYGIEVYRF